MHKHALSAAAACGPFVAGTLLWEASARVADVPFLPPFTVVVAALFDLVRSGRIVTDLASSLLNLLAGFAAAVVVGISGGVAMARSRRVELVLAPYLHAVLAAPSLIFVPILFTVFGVSRLTHVAVVFLNAVFVIASVTSTGLRDANPRLVEMARAFSASDRQIFWRIRWPSARPFVLSGLHVGVLLAVKGMINGEMFIAFTGLGSLVRASGARFESDRVLAVVLVVLGVGFVCTAVINAIARRHSPAG